MTKSQILCKLESSSVRVKGLSFHPKRPWILASLHDGSIQLWDYRMEVLVDRFFDHVGPVRGVCFHSSQPLFVSGGDDYKIKVWNYQLRRCLFNLLGHIDYIRTVQFHHEAPWILSASDDQTIRIWNWQSRTSLAVISGHDHYIMCARFHPTDMLVVSASLDSTVRVWDISAIRGRSSGGDVFGGPLITVRHVIEGHSRGVNWASFHPNMNLIVSCSDDRDVRVWRILNDTTVWPVETYTGHMSNVSCVMFHPTKDLIISNSEDKTMRVWDVNKNAQTTVIKRDNDRYWVLDIHPKNNLMAAGHDSGFFVFKLQRERPALCVDHASYRAFYVTQSAQEPILNEVNYKTGKHVAILSLGRNAQLPKIMHYNTSNKSVAAFLFVSAEHQYEILTMPRADFESGRTVASATRHRSYGRAAVFVSSTRFAVLDKQRNVLLKSLTNEVKRKIVFANAQNLFPGGIGRIVVRTSDSLVLYDVHALKIVAELAIHPRHVIKYVCWSPDGKYVAFLAKNNIYVTTSRLSDAAHVAETSRIKAAAWDPAGVLIYTTATHVKYMLPNGDRGIVRTLDEIVYLTAIADGELCYLDRSHTAGKMKLNSTEYLFKLALFKHRSKEVVRMMTAKQLIGMSIITYLQQKGYPEIAMHFVDDLRTKLALALECGAISVAWECANKLDVPECWQRLGAEALKQGNYEVVEAAYLKVRNFQALTFLYLITGNRTKLQRMVEIATIRRDIQGRFVNSLYLGDVKERVKVLRESGHVKLAFVCASLHGLKEEVASLAEELKDDLPSFAEVQKVFGSHTTPTGAPLASLLLPRAPLLAPSTAPASATSGESGSPSSADAAGAGGVGPNGVGGWPLVAVARGFDFSREGTDEETDADKEEAAARAALLAAAARDEEEDMGWGSGGPDDGSSTSTGMSAQGGASAGAGAGAAKTPAASTSSSWGVDVDLDLGLDDDEAEAAAAPEHKVGSTSAGAGNKPAGGEALGLVVPQHGTPFESQWASQAVLVGDLAAAGAFDQAMHLLNQQIGAVNMTRFKESFLHYYAHAQVYAPTYPGMAPLVLPVQRTPAPQYMPDPSGNGASVLGSPLGRYTMATIAALRNQGMAAIMQGEEGFATVQSCMGRVMAQVPMLVLPAQLKNLMHEVVPLIHTAREYLIATKLVAAKLDVGRREGKEQSSLIKQAELAAYATTLELAPVHQMMMLWVACNHTLAVQAYRTCGGLARRLEDLSRQVDMEQVKDKIKMDVVKKMLRKCELEGGNDKITLNFNPSMVVCAHSLTQVPATKAAEGRDVHVCPYCNAKFAKEYEGKLCAVCEIAKIGAIASGLKITP